MKTKTITISDFNRYDVSRWVARDEDGILVGYKNNPPCLIQDVGRAGNPDAVTVAGLVLGNRACCCIVEHDGDYIHVIEPDDGVYAA